jgi:hypothetical protein
VGRYLIGDDNLATKTIYSLKLYGTGERPDPAGGRDDTRMAVTNDMSETTVAERALARDRAGRQDGVRKTSLGVSIALLVQYALGMWVNL